MFGRFSARKMADEAFEIALKDCAVIKLTGKEVVMVVQAVDCPFPVAGGSAEGKSLLSVVPPPMIELPLINSATLAAVMTKYVKEHLLPLHYSANTAVVVDRPAFSMTEKQADTALKNLRSLIEGPWKKAKQCIFMLTSREMKGCGRPSEWSSRSVNCFVDVLKLPTAGFADCMGTTFLRIDSAALSSVHGVQQSLLQIRFRLYQRVLNLLEQWWDRGLRPTDTSDTHSAKIAGITVGDRTEYFGSKSGLGSSFHSLNTSPTRSNYRNNRPFSSPARLFSSQSGSPLYAPPSTLSLSSFSPKSLSPMSLLPWRYHQQQLQQDELAGWGHIKRVPKLTHNYLDILDKRMVQVAPFQMLLHAWEPMNRAYGWGVPLDLLSAVAVQFGGKIMYLVRPKKKDLSVGKGTNKDMNSNRGKGNNLGGWDRDKVAGGEGNSEQEEENVVRECRLVAPDPDVENSETCIKMLSDLRERLTCLVKESYTGEDAILVPTTCLRSLPSPQRKDRHQMKESGDVNTDNNSSRKSNTMESIKVGHTVRVVEDLMALSRACARFDWWDRPAPEQLAKMAGRKGEIVSISELQSKQRVGVRVMAPVSTSAHDSGLGYYRANNGLEIGEVDEFSGVKGDKGWQEIIDALPLEALIICSSERPQLADKGSRHRLFHVLSNDERKKTSNRISNANFTSPDLHQSKKHSKRKGKRISGSPSVKRNHSPKQSGISSRLYQLRQTVSRHTIIPLEDDNDGTLVNKGDPRMTSPSIPRWPEVLQGVTLAPSRTTLTPQK